MRVLFGPKYRDYVGALLLALLGTVVTAKSVDYTVGSLTRMGPGFIPAALGVILVMVALALFLATLLGQRFRTRAPTHAAIEPEPLASTKPEWRGWICICLGVLIFAGLAEHAGLIPATFVSVFVTALGDRENRLRDALLLGLGLTVAGVLIFWWGLGVLLPLVTWNFT